MNGNSRERESHDYTIRSLDYPDDLRPDPSQLPSGDELADLLEDIARRAHGLEPLHGKSPVYHRELRIYSRDTLIVREGKVFIPEPPPTEKPSTSNP